jgi:hypothetical protein
MDAIPRTAASQRAKRHPAPLPRRGAAKRRLDHIRRAVSVGQFLGAWSQYEALRAEVQPVPLDEPTLRSFIDGVHREQDWRAAAVLLADYIARFPGSGATQARLMLAGLYVQEQQRPRAALHVLEGLNNAPLSGTQREYLQRVRSKAELQINAGVLELSAPSS